ncbi:hypothetical protein [Dactylosporangium sp. CA-233914]|uniref:hypothetical protein n=1 Tax=Dactylosporangium sp. CA-233914 TaxID=3239934 RepID=UPI003D94BC08
MLSVELEELARAGRVGLPALAGVYSRAVADLDAVRHDDAEWCALRAQLVSVLAGAARQVEEAAAAVCAVTANYAWADTAARDGLRR